MKEVIYIGIDPGGSGAYGYISKGDDMVEVANDFTSIQQAFHDLFQWKNNNCTIKIAILEKVNAMPNEGVTSSFKFGTNYGMWQGVLTALRIPFKLVHPRTWQKGLVYKTDGKDSKERSLTVARRLFPDVDLHRKKDHGKADALLMAYYARSLD